MLKVIEAQELDKRAWADLVKASPVATWFQTHEAYGFFESLSFMETFAFGVLSEGVLKGVVVGYIQRDGGRLKQFFSRRAIVLGGPLLSEDIADEELRALLSAMKTRLKRKAIYIETRNFNDYSRWRKVFEQCGFDYEAHYNVHMDTSLLETVNGKMDRNRRRNIKRAKENGVIIDENPSWEEVQKFYSQLDELFRKKVKLPLYPYEFFAKLKNMSSSRFFVAKDATGEVIGGLACVALEGRALYAWAACGDDQNHKDLSPSVMVNYAAICHAAKNGFPVFDFMGAGKPDDGGYGVRDFKLKFGGELVEHGRFVQVCHPLLYGLGKCAVKILKKL